MSKQRTRQSSRLDKRRERREELRRKEQEQKQGTRRGYLIFAGIVLALVLIIAGAVYWAKQQPQTSTNAANPPVDNISCDGGEHDAFHIHAHLTLYVDGKQVPVAQNVGISGQSCFYWLHTHDTTGVIHIEAPANHAFTLGNFLDIWGNNQFAQQGYPSQLDQTTGWQVYVNGKLYTGNFRSIPLKAHALITMAYNTPSNVVHPDTTYNWGQL